MQCLQAMRDDPVQCIKQLIKEVSAFKQAEPELIHVIRQELMLESERAEFVRKPIFPMWGLLRECLEAGKRQHLFHFQSTDLALISVLGVLMLGSSKPEFQTLLQHATAFIRTTSLVDEGGMIDGCAYGCMGCSRYYYSAADLDDDLGNQ